MTYKLDHNPVQKVTHIFFLGLWSMDPNITQPLFDISININGH